MNEKIALVIGGSGDIGLETAKSIAKQGIKVCLTFNKNELKLKELRKSNPENYFIYKMDLLDDQSIKDAISRIIQEHHTIDIVVHCVSPRIANKQILDLCWEEFQEQIDVQIKGLFTVVQSLSGLIKSNHRIKFIAVLTEACLGKPPTELAYYITAKYGLMGFMKSMCSELTANNCTFNMVSPGMVETKLLDNMHSKIKEVASFKNPMKRIAQPTDVAEIIAYLISEKANYLNGVNIPVNGGNILI